MQEQQQKPPLKLEQKLQIANQVRKIIHTALSEDSTARQTEDLLVKRFEQLNIPAQFIQTFRDRLKKVRQAASDSYIEETYIMGGILIYCGILLPVLINIGIPDSPSRLAWIAFAISFPGAAGFLLIRFLKDKNSISGNGKIHSALASLTEIGILTTTTSLFFHIWNVAGWLFLLWVFTIFLVYQWYRFGIYYKPFLAIFRDTPKDINDTPPSEKEAEP